MCIDVYDLHRSSVSVLKLGMGLDAIFKFHSKCHPV